jgi:monothiol glutaredoxin
MASPTPPEPRGPRGDAEPGAWIAEVVRTHPVVLFMKGSPESPMCGFSANAASILAGHGVKPYHVDVLIDPEVREAVKAFSSWPTLPQVYVGGEFLGGADILRELHESGELAARLAAAATPA